MADGDHLFHDIVRDPTALANSTPVSTHQIDVPVGTDGLVRIRGWVKMLKSDASKYYYVELAGIGDVHSGSFGLLDQSSFGEIDGASAAWSAQLSIPSGNLVGILVVGEANVLVDGRLEVDVTEQALSGGG